LENAPNLSPAPIPSLEAGSIKLHFAMKQTSESNVVGIEGKNLFAFFFSSGDGMVGWWRRFNNRGGRVSRLKEGH
jgi:hypothetical protein